jgi:DNA invertase Pin-like site-specific DNA recombinase
MKRENHAMLIGYARTSTLDQEAGLEAQIRDLKAAGVEEENIFFEQLSSVDAKRPKLEEALRFLRRSDTLVVTKMDRLARSVANYVEIEKKLSEKKVALRVLNLGIDTSTPTGRLVHNTLMGIAQFEREIMLERQREGIAKAKGEGKFLGRKPTARMKAEEVRKLNAEGLGPVEIAEKLGISRASVWRILNSPADVEARLQGRLDAWRHKNEDNGKAA